MNALTRRTTLAAFAIPIVFSLLPLAAHAQENDLVKVILEQIELGNGLTISNKATIDAASKILANREKASKELVASLLFARGMAYLRTHELVKAKKDADELCSSFGANSGALIFRAAVLLELNQYDDAIAEAKKSLKLNPKDAKPHCLIASALLAKEDVKGALFATEDAREIDPKYATTYLLQGMILRRYDPTECLNAMNKFLELVPIVGSPDAECVYYCKGYALSLLNRPEEAAENLLVAHKINPKEIGNAHELALIYADLGKFHLAAHYADKCILLNRDHPIGYCLAAEYYSKIGRMKDARAMGKRAVAFSEKDKSFLCSLGDIHVAIGKYATALEYYDKAIERSPNHFLATVKKASLLATCPDKQLRDGKKAILLADAACEKKATIEWLQWRVLMVLAEANAECGNFDKAVSYAKMAIERAGPEFGRRREFRSKLSMFEKKTPYRLKAPVE